MAKVRDGQNIMTYDDKQLNEQTTRNTKVATSWSTMTKIGSMSMNGYRYY
jgi:hypothetical protein